MDRQKESHLTVRAGLVPSQEVGLPYKITTEQAEAFLQKSADTLAYAIEKETGKKYRWNISLYAFGATPKFLPFIMVLPDSALANDEDYYDKDAEDIFRPNTTRRRIHIQDDFYCKFLKAFKYDDSDMGLFRSTSWRLTDGQGASRKTLQEFARMVNPRTIVTDARRGVTRTVVMIDPLRVFHAMLTSDTDPRDFLVNIQSWKKISNSNYEFIMIRKLNKGNNRAHKRSVASDLAAYIADASRR